MVYGFGFRVSRVLSLTGGGCLFVRDWVVGFQVFPGLD